MIFLDAEGDKIGVTTVDEHEADWSEGLGVPRGDPELISEVSAHCERFFGPVEFVIHEIVSEYVHVDLHVFGIDPLAGTRSIVTTGLAERAMNVSPKEENPEKRRYAELVLQLPADWPVTGDRSEDERYWWPLRVLKSLARYPHMYETWIWKGHTLGDEPPEHLGPGTELSSALLMPSDSISSEFEVLSMKDGREVTFLLVTFLFSEERDVMRRNGYDALIDILEGADIGWDEFSVLNPNRKNAGAHKRRRWPFGKK